jgi:hypothetical protein
VSGTSLQVTTASGTQAYALASGTHIIKVSKGTTADLVKNARVELHLVSGTTTADAVEVDLIAKGQGTKAPGTKPAHSGTPRPTPSTTPTAPRHGRPARIGTAGATPKRGAHAGGQIVSVSGNTITVSSWNGQQASYTLTNTVTITKVSAGNASDLAKGQTVQVVATSSNTAVEVTILAS